jgi:hypothetical protein
VSFLVGPQSDDRGRLCHKLVVGFGSGPAAEVVGNIPFWLHKNDEPPAELGATDRFGRLVFGQVDPGEVYTLAPAPPLLVGAPVSHEAGYGVMAMALGGGSSQGTRRWERVVRCSKGSGSVVVHRSVAGKVTLLVDGCLCPREGERVDVYWTLLGDQRRLAGVMGPENDGLAELGADVRPEVGGRLELEWRTAGGTLLESAAFDLERENDS